MKYWWLDDSGRVAAEQAAVEQITAEGWFMLNGWTLHDYRFCAEGTITAHGHEYPVRLIYPDQYPSAPAWVEPQDEKSRWSIHQYGDGGPLCLELRPDNWIVTANGADVLRSAYNLLHKENPLGEGTHERVKSAHHIGAIQAYARSKEPVFIGAGCLARIVSGTSEDVSSIRWSADDGVWPILVFDAVDRAKPEHPPSFDLGTLRFELNTRVGGALTPGSDRPKDRAGYLEQLGVSAENLADDAAVLLLAVGAESITPFHSTSSEKVFERDLIVLPEQEGKRSGRSEKASGKSVAIVGLGSVGSKLAESLLRSGLRKFVFVDGDVFLPANLERHILDWRDVGFRKAFAVRRRLQQIVPKADIEVISSNLNWQKSAKVHDNHVLALGDCDIVVDATGDLPTSLFLGAVAAENNKPFVSAAVFEGGLGCMIARAIPGRDPTFAQGRSGYVAYCEEKNVPAPSSGHRQYEALSEDGEPVVADDAAVTMTAGHTARVILDIVDGQVDPEDHPWLLIGFRRDWLFTRHGESISLAMDATPIPAKPSDEAATLLALKLAKEALDALKAS